MACSALTATVSGEALITANTELDLTIYNRTTGATCTGLKILSNTTLQCIGDADATRGIAGLTGGGVVMGDLSNA